MRFFVVFKQNECLYPRISLMLGKKFDFATGDHGKILLLPPPPTEPRRLLEITEKFCYYHPPPLNRVGFWRSRKRLKKFNNLNLAALRIEAVQRRAARFCFRRYKRSSSPTLTQADLGWSLLSARREQARLILMFKLCHSLVNVNSSKTLIPITRPTRLSHPYVSETCSCQKIPSAFFLPTNNSPINGTACLPSWYAHPPWMPSVVF